jgi:hypothetical protein
MSQPNLPAEDIVSTTITPHPATRSYRSYDQFYGEVAGQGHAADARYAHVLAPTEDWKLNIILPEAVNYIDSEIADAAAGHRIHLRIVELLPKQSLWNL